MRRFMKEKTFKGSCNIEFGTKEEAEEFIKREVMFAGVALTDKEMLADREANFEERNVHLDVGCDGVEALHFQSEEYCSV